MVLGLYSIYDKVAEQYGPVWQARNDAVAVRAARKVLESVAPWDRDAYVIREVGMVDDQSGVVTGQMIRDVEFDPKWEDSDAQG